MSGERTGTVLSTTINLFANMVGVAVLSFPHAAGRGGLVLFSVCFLLDIFGLFFSMTMLCRVAREENVATYQGILKSYFGERSALGLQVVFICLGTMVIASYIIVAADSFHDVVFPHSVDVGIIMAGAALVVLPVALPRKLEGLKHASAVSNTALFLIFVSIFIDCVGGGNGKEKTPVSASPLSAEGGLSVAPVLMGGFAFHINGVRGYGELRDPDDWQKVLRYLCILAPICYISFVSAGLIAYGSEVSGDIQMELSGTLGSISKVSMGVGSLLKAPLMVQPMREMVKSLLHLPKESKVVHICVTGIIMAGAFSFSYAIGSLSTAVSLFSGTCGVTIASIVPGIVILSYARRLAERRRRKFRNLGSISEELPGVMLSYAPMEDFAPVEGPPSPIPVTALNSNLSCPIRSPRVGMGQCMSLTELNGSLVSFPLRKLSDNRSGPSSPQAGRGSCGTTPRNIGDRRTSDTCPIRRLTNSSTPLLSELSFVNNSPPASPMGMALPLTPLSKHAVVLPSILRRPNAPTLQLETKALSNPSGGEPENDEVDDMDPEEGQEEEEEEGPFEARTALSPIAYTFMGCCFIFLGIMTVTCTFAARILGR